EQGSAGAGPGGCVPGEKRVAVRNREWASDVCDSGLVQDDLAATGRGGEGAVGRGGLVQEDGGRRGGGHVAGGVLVPGVDGLGPISTGQGIRKRDAEIRIWRYPHPARCRGGGRGRAGGNEVADNAARVGGREAQRYARGVGGGGVSVDLERARRGRIAALRRGAGCRSGGSIAGVVGGAEAVVVGGANGEAGMGIVRLAAREQRRAGAGRGARGAGKELVAVRGGQAAAGVGGDGPVQGDLAAAGRGGEGAVGRRGLVQEDGGRSRGGDVAGGVLVPGVDGLGAITAGQGVGEEAAGVVDGRGHRGPASGAGGGSSRGGG